ncbi:ATP-binding cassette domain-containing protein [Nocardioides immobilis]|uniref:ATP-binding cassette domain-containing protein n=1 Tax=Nocardioides immobilis TaxID=2049295 RepID=A0A417XT83_9ACTN|nr:ATP-binding cassette domain-containing protein [Nocardioides immobilis]RHW23662.1 ATP-binding cassette domain-containing protein [Nocardioides immobilis]
MQLRERLNSGVMVGAGLIALALAPLLFGTSVQSISTLSYVVSILLVAVGLNIVMGFAGQLFLGPGAIFAISGYACAIVTNQVPSLGLGEMCLIGVVAALISSVIVAVPALRVGGFYLGMTTLYLALVVPALATHLEIAGQDSGISLLANLDWVRPINGYNLYLCGVGLLLLMLLFSFLVLHSRVGRRLIALRDSEILASALGVRGYTTKLYAYLLAAVPTGVAAAYYVYSQQFISPGSFAPILSIYILAACVIGGFGTVAGPVTGGVIVFGFMQYSGGLNQYQGIVLGIVLVSVSLLIPNGLPELAVRARAAFQRRRGTSVVAAHGAVAAIESGAIARIMGRPKGDATLTVAGMSKSFGAVKAVRDVSLTALPGQIHALIGANGSGKTTLLNLISGMYAPTAGTATLGGAVVSGHGAVRPVRHGIARTFQTPKLSLGRTVRDNLVVAIEQVDKCRDISSLLRLPGGRRNYRRAFERADAALEACGIGGYRHHLAGEVPHGVQRLIEVARALAVSPQMVLLDEPAAGLSASEMAVLKDIIVGIADAGAGVVIIEHNLNVVFDVAHQVTVLHQGEVIASGTSAHVRSAAAVSDAYLGAGVSAAAGEAELGPTGRGGAEPGDPVLQVRDLTAGYGKLPVVTGIDLDVRPGEILAVLGRNGVGKTTTLHAIGGMRHGMNGGSVRLAGQEVGQQRPDRIAAAGLALVPEGRRIALTLTVEDNLRLGAFVHGRQSQAETQRRLESVYDLFPALREKRNEPASRLSGGQQQMVAVGQALMAEPSVLLLDEPMAGLAPKLCDEIYAVLHLLKERSMAIIVVDQSVDRSLHNADRYVVIEDGKEVAAGDCRGADSRDRISRILLGSAEQTVSV